MTSLDCETYGGEEVPQKIKEVFLQIEAIRNALRVRAKLFVKDEVTAGAMKNELSTMLLMETVRIKDIICDGINVTIVTGEPFAVKDIGLDRTDD